MCKCKICGESDASVDFYASIKTYCKQHWKEKVKAHRVANSDHYKEFDRNRANQPERIALRKAYQKTIAFKESHIAANEKYRMKYPNKKNATTALNKALLAGKVEKHACFICGDSKTEGHHPDYDAPLDVIWLCDLHHKQAHVLARSVIRNEHKRAA
jgi:hypothetical protein